MWWTGVFCRNFLIISTNRAWEKEREMDVNRLKTSFRLEKYERWKRIMLGESRVMRRSDSDSQFIIFSSLKLVLKQRTIKTYTTNVYHNMSYYAISKFWLLSCSSIISMFPALVVKVTIVCAFLVLAWLLACLLLFLCLINGQLSITVIVLDTRTSLNDGLKKQ